MERVSAHLSIMQEMGRDRDCISPSTAHMLTEKHSVSSELLHAKYGMVIAASTHSLHGNPGSYDLAQVKPFPNQSQLFCKRLWCKCTAVASILGTARGYSKQFAK